MSDDPEDETEADANYDVTIDQDLAGTDYSDMYAARGDVVLRAAAALETVKDVDARKLFIALSNKLMATIPAATPTRLGKVVGQD